MADLLTLLGYGVTMVALSDPTLGGVAPATEPVVAAEPDAETVVTPRRRRKGTADA